MDPDVSAFLTAALLTLMGATWLMTFVPRCDHKECRAAHEEASKVERKKGDELRRHAWHDRFRPQADCALCQVRPKDDEP